MFRSDFDLLDPLKHITADLSRLKDSLDLNQWIMVLYVMFFRSASFCASSVMNLSASLPVPPYGVNTRGLKEPCSISITRWLYIRFFSFSLLLKAVSSFWFRWQLWRPNVIFWQIQPQIAFKSLISFYIKKLCYLKIMFLWISERAGAPNPT